MGFTSMDDWLNKITNSGQILRTDWTKTNPAALVIGRWYDMSLMPGIPPINIYGELTYNDGPVGSGWGWTGLAAGGWTYTANTLLHVGGTAGNVSQPSMATVAGRYYQVTFTLAWTSGTSITPSINGTNGTARSTAATHSEVIGPVGASGGLVFTPTTNAQCSITAISVIETAVGGAPMSHVVSDTCETGALYTGGNQTPKTKHIINAGVVSCIGTGVPGVAMLCDILLAYPLINGNTAAAQTLTTTNVLTRYTDGAGVRPFLVATTALGATTPVATTITYTNQAGAGSKTPPLAINSNSPASSAIATIVHSGVSVNNYGPFIPLASGDTGVRSVEAITMAASGSTSTMALVLAKPLFSMPISTLGVLAERDLLNQFPSMPRIYDGAYLGWLFLAGATTAANTPFFGYCDICYG